MTNIGYERVSTDEQTTALQHDALIKAGCDRIFSDVASGATTKRPGFDELRAFLRPGDTVVVWRLDRLGRNTKGLIELVDEWGGQGISLMSLTEQIDTSSANGRFFMQVIAAFAELERNLVIERTRAGLAAARKRGRYGGRPRKLSASMAMAANVLHQQGELTRRQIASQLGVSISTVARAIRDGKNEQQGNHDA